jgi:hypothetical protein
MSTPTSKSMHLFPSTLAAIVVGAIGMPLFLLGWKFIKAHTPHQGLILLWSVAAFFIPTYFAISDRAYHARRRRELGSFFRPLVSADDFRFLYIPAWKRMFVMFVSTVISGLILKSVGLPL